MHRDVRFGQFNTEQHLAVALVDFVPGRLNGGGAAARAAGSDWQNTASCVGSLPATGFCGGCNRYPGFATKPGRRDTNRRTKFVG